MKPEEFYEIIRRALEDGVSLDLQTIIVVAVVALVGAFIGSYLKTKAKNLATKEDIHSITNEIENIKTEYAKQLQLLNHEHRILENSLQQKYDLSVAALEKRLAIHQEAYVLWWELMGSASKRDQVWDCVMKCQDWFVKNSLYLSADARDAFSEAFRAASIHPDLLHPRASAEEIKANFAKVHRAGPVLVQAVSLPSWGEKEYSPIAENQKKDG